MNTAQLSDKADTRLPKVDKTPAKRTTITIPESIYLKAIELMRARDFGDFSGYLQQLIREDFERRRGPATLEANEPRPTANPPGQPVKYPKPRHN